LASTTDQANLAEARDAAALAAARYPSPDGPRPDYNETSVPAAPAPELRKITVETVKDSLRKGFDDFKAVPGYGLFFAGVYVVGGLVLWALVRGIGNAGVLVPLAFAFPLIGPFLAIGLYEVSRRREKGEPLDRGAILGAVFRQRDGQMPFMGVVILFLTLVWLVLVRITFALFLSDDAMTNIFSTREAIFTFDGLVMLFLVTVLGAAFALLVFSLTVIGMPLLLDREIDAVTASITSVQAVVENFRPMMVWAGIVVAMLAVGMLPAFLGLLVVLPVLGHGTWHLFRATVV
jgi:uncharacterized membrane protein